MRRHLSAMRRVQYKGLDAPFRVLNPFTPPDPEKRRASDEGLDESLGTCGERVQDWSRSPSATAGVSPGSHQVVTRRHVSWRSEDASRHRTVDWRGTLEIDNVTKQ